MTIAILAALLSVFVLLLTFGAFKASAYSPEEQKTEDDTQYNALREAARKYGGIYGLSQTICGKRKNNE